MEEKYSKINLSKFCRACLSETDDMKNMLDDEEHLFEMFVNIGSLNIEIKESDLPFCICKQCEEMLNISFKFRKQCQKSNRALSDYITAKQTTKDNTAKFDDTAVIIEQPKSYLDDSLCAIKSKSNRLTRYEYSTVADAIERSKQNFYKNINCIRCGFTGSNARALSVHVSHVHKELKESWCWKCNKVFENLPQHIETHENDGDTKCQFCNKQFQAAGRLTEHLLSHSDVRPYRCTFCVKCFISQRHLNVHLRTHTNEKPYKCSFCTKSFNQYYRLRKHFKQHENDKNELVCKDDSGPVFVESANVDDNKSDLVSMIAQNFCAKCNKKVRSLTVHTRKTHSVGMDSVNVELNSSDNKLCTVCGKQFKTASKLKVHMRVHTGETPYKCSYCNKRFSTRNQLVLHERTHTGERPHICHVCGKNFTQSSVLNTHMKLHTGRPVACNLCDQRFCRTVELRLHLRKHTGEKPYLCSECGQAFIQRSHLVEHNKTHSDLRPYQCSYCDKAFKQSSSLKAHVHIHSGEKPFKCTQCSYACRQSYSLTQHMKNHTGDSLKTESCHSCTMCDAEFKTAVLLSTHINTVHNVTYLNI